jgi:hypothetical protein
MSPSTTATTINLTDRVVVPSFHHTTISMDAMHHRTATLTCTDDPSDIPLNADGTLPTPAQKALDILTNTTTRAVINRETHTWELLTIRHAPFEMPLSEQIGENWWIAVDSSAVAAEKPKAEPKVPKSDLTAMMESAREAIEVIELGIDMEESMTQTDVLLEDLRHRVGLEVQLHELRVQQMQVARRIQRREQRREMRSRRRQTRHLGPDCKSSSLVVVDIS